MAYPRLSAELIAETLAAYDAAGGNITEAARALGLPRPTFKCRREPAGFRKRNASTNVRSV